MRLSLALCPKLASPHALPNECCPFPCPGKGYLADVELIGRIALESLYVGHELRIGNDHKGQEWGLGDNAATLPGSPP